jgi:hypothetical protein
VHIFLKWNSRCAQGKRSRLRRLDPRPLPALRGRCGPGIDNRPAFSMHFVFILTGLNTGLKPIKSALLHKVKTK